ncbi:MAG: uroporphyrin-III C-methyltransferase [Caulobacteraceae bacterium]|nr:uroporphyrin-III C-methyltransferase [Caulobacteraceae bacterium]
MLVGAGPGAPDLLTVRALRAIEGAQALLYDALVGEEILALAPRPCLRIRTGKLSGGVSMKQDEINVLMLKLAMRGLTVVRLKGGDPSVFGRCGEERDYLEARGVAVAVVPGVTAASAAAAQFGFPLTHRGEARRVTFATARTHDGSLVEGGWDAGADPETTLVLYMARDAAGQAADRLMACGRSPSTPAIAVENAGRKDARLVQADLSTLGAVVETAALRGPVLLVIGEVAAKAANRGASPPSAEGPLPEYRPRSGYGGFR